MMTMPDEDTDSENVEYVPVDQNQRSFDFGFKVLNYRIEPVMLDINATTENQKLKKTKSRCNICRKEGNFCLLNLKSIHFKVFQSFSCFSESLRHFRKHFFL